MTDLSVIIPARNETYLARTIEDILANMRGNTEVIAICDGAWPDPPIKDHPRVTLIHHAESIGQRAATNEGARLSRAEFVMKCDAHCSFDEGFDVKLTAECEDDWTMVPRMYNLHVFDWVCPCGWRQYQGPRPDKCEQCGGTELAKDIVWKRKSNTGCDYMWFNRELKFSYFDRHFLGPLGDDIRALKRKYDHKHRPWAKGDITDQMTAIGACWMMKRKRYWQLQGLDESWGSWGQMGTEIACKSWLTGGRQVVNKKTWFAHLFRTKKDFGWPYPNPGVSTARRKSREMIFDKKLPGQVRPIEWLIEHFAPVPTWD